MYHLISGKDVIAVLWFALSGFSRSNGILNAGYFCFQTMHQAYDAVFLRKRAFVGSKFFYPLSFKNDTYYTMLHCPDYQLFILST